MKENGEQYDEPQELRTTDPTDNPPYWQVLGTTVFKIRVFDASNVRPGDTIPEIPYKMVESDLGTIMGNPLFQLSIIINEPEVKNE